MSFQLQATAKVPYLPLLRKRLFLFTTGFAGAALFRAARQFPQIEIVGVATDDPANPKANCSGRACRLYKSWFHEVVRKEAAKSQLRIFQGDISGEAFARTFEESRPDLCFMACFGQRIPRKLIDQVHYFVNFHHARFPGDWPSALAGAQPAEALLRLGETKFCICAHQIDERLDQGWAIDFSSLLALRPNVQPSEIYLWSTPLIKKLAIRILRCYLDDEHLTVNDTRSREHVTTL